MCRGGNDAYTRVRCGVGDSLCTLAHSLRTADWPDVNGNLHVPDAFHTSYELLGIWAVAADAGQGSRELHIVRASPGAIDAYRKNGRFPDGAVLVKEVFQTATMRTLGRRQEAGAVQPVEDRSGKAVAGRPVASVA
jgi:hypothetical protein